MITNHNARYERIVSAGIYCQPAWQIRRFTSLSTPSYFDWTESPHRGLIMMLEHRFRDFFRKERLCITDDKRAVRDLDTEIVYPHHFSVRPSLVPVTQEMVDQGYERQKAVLDLLGQFWMRGMQARRTLFVRQGCSSVDEALELYQVLKSLGGAVKCGLLLVCPPGRSPKIDHCDIHVEQGPEDIQKANEWMGDDGAWNQILRKYWGVSPE